MVDAGMGMYQWESPRGGSRYIPSVRGHVCVELELVGGNKASSILEGPCTCATVHWR